MKVKCSAKEHNAMTRSGLEPRPLDSDSLHYSFDLSDPHSKQGILRNNLYAKHRAMPLRILSSKRQIICKYLLKSSTGDG